MTAKSLGVDPTVYQLVVLDARVDRLADQVTKLGQLRFKTEDRNHDLCDGLFNPHLSGRECVGQVAADREGARIASCIRDALSELTVVVPRLTHGLAPSSLAGTESVGGSPASESAPDVGDDTTTTAVPA